MIFSILLMAASMATALDVFRILRWGFPSQLAFGLELLGSLGLGLASIGALKDRKTGCWLALPSLLLVAVFNGILYGTAMLRSQRELALMLAGFALQLNLPLTFSLLLASFTALLAATPWAKRCPRWLFFDGQQGHRGRLLGLGFVTGVLLCLFTPLVVGSELQALHAELDRSKVEFGHLSRNDPWAREISGEFQRRMLALADQSPSTESGARAYLAVVKLGSRTAEMEGRTERAVNALLCFQKNSPVLEEAARWAGCRPDLLLRISREAALPNSRAAALFRLATQELNEVRRNPLRVAGAREAFERIRREYSETWYAKEATKYLGELASCLIGMPVPELEGEDQDGKRLALSDFKGNVIVLYFWSFG